MFKSIGATVLILVAGLAVIAPMVRAKEAVQADLRQRKIVFDSEGDGQWDIYVMNPDGSKVRRLTPTVAKGKSAQFPDWSPDGNQIAFASNREVNWEIYVMNADGSDAQRLTYTTGEGKANAGPAWSPDGKQIAFDSTRDGNWEIYVMDADGANPRRLTQHEKVDARPAWSRDGKRIAFHSTRDGKLKDDTKDDFEIYVMNADGLNVRRLTSNKTFDGHSDW